MILLWKADILENIIRKKYDFIVVHIDGKLQKIKWLLTSSVQMLVKGYPESFFNNNYVFLKEMYCPFTKWTTGTDTNSF